MVYDGEMSYSVNQVARLAGITKRTLHYYDQIGLLHPSKIAPNGYRQYEDNDLLRLQQILFYRELDLPLERIRSIVESPNFNVLEALEDHRAALERKSHKITSLLMTIDNTITHMKGKMTMEKKELFTGFSEEEQRKYELEARELWGDEQVGASMKRWNSYSKVKQKQILAEAGEIYIALVKYMEKGAGSKDVQALIARWHQNLRYFYEPTREILLGLVQAYNDHPGFQKTFRSFHPDLARFMQTAVEIYVRDLH